MTPPIKVEIDGRDLAVLRRRLRAVSKEIDKELRRALKLAVDEGPTKEARRRAPRRTGRFERSIKTFVQARRIGVRSKLPYASVIEFNQRHPVFGNRDVWVPQGSDPVIRPAVADTLPETARKVETALATHIDKALEV